MNLAIIGDAHSSLLEYLESNNISYTVFSDKTKLLNQLPEKTVFTNFQSIESLIEDVRKIHELTPFTAAFTIYERYIVSAARINEALGLPGLGEAAAIACTDKSVMRSMFASASKKISPDYMIIQTLDDLKNFASTHDFPLILKPANLAKSLLVMKCSDEHELLSNYDAMLARIDAVYEKYAPHNEKVILVEEFMNGSIHSVDAFVDGQGEATVLPYIVDYRSGYDIGYNDNFHYSRIMPSTLAPSVQEEFIATAKIGIEALGMKNTAAHVEIIVTNTGPKIVEIGARNGGYRERMHKIAQGIDIYKNWIDTITGQPIILKASKNDPCAVLELFPKESGRFSTINNLEKLRELSSLKYLSIKYKTGETCGKSSEGYKAACVIMLHNSSKEQFYSDLEFINENVYVVTETTNR